MIFSMLLVSVLKLWFWIKYLLVIDFIVWFLWVVLGRLLVSNSCRFFFFVNIVFVVLLVLGVVMILVKMLLIVLVVGLFSGWLIVMMLLNVDMLLYVSVVLYVLINVVLVVML